MTELALPPWELKDGLIDYDPFTYTWDDAMVDLQRLCGRPYHRYPEPVAEPADPNERDGQWMKQAFMPHIAYIYDGHTIPGYLTVDEAVDHPDACKMNVYWPNAMYPGWTAVIDAVTLR